jgi:Ca-activated chloride channel family protein
MAMAAVIAPLRSQSPSGLRILSPEADSYLSGPTLLRAAVDPGVKPTRVVFFADGREVCALTMPPFECTWNAGQAIVGHQIRVVASVEGGPRLVQTVRTRAAAATFRSQLAIVQVPVSVRDGRRFVAGLPRDAFRIYEDDREERLTGFAAEDVPLELIVAVDVSDSMAADLPQLKTAAAELLGAIPAGTAVTVIAFNHEAFPIAVRQTDPALRLAALDKLKSWGSTALYDTIVLGVNRFGQQQGRKVLVVFTDGEDQGSRATLADAQVQLRDSDAVVYVVGAGRALGSEAFRRGLRVLSEATGGRAIFTDRIDRLREVFRELVEELSAQYLLSYIPTRPDADGTWRRIRVAVKGYDDVRARQGYRAVASR